jgi:hypothetical protein
MEKDQSLFSSEDKLFDFGRLLRDAITHIDQRYQNAGQNIKAQEGFNGRDKKTILFVHELWCQSIKTYGCNLEFVVDKNVHGVNFWLGKIRGFRRYGEKPQPNLSRLSGKE